MLKPSITQGSLEDVQTAAERSKSIRELARSFPELEPGVSGFPELAQESELVRKNVSHHDPGASDLFAFGKANDQRLRHRKQRITSKKVPILAVAGGPARDAVRLVLLLKEHVGWEKDKNVRLTNFLLQDQEQAWWFTNGSPVQQLCFAGNNGTAKARLAVRYHDAITVFEPILHANAVPARSFHDQNSRRAKYSEARLDANPVLNITTERTGGSPHADVSFNPWRTAQFAIIDSRGHWTTWELKPSSRLVDQKDVDAGPSGFVSDDQTDALEPNPESNRGDGWGSIIWAGNKSTLVVADRKTLSIFSTENGTNRLHVPNLFEPGGTDQIIDMKRSHMNSAHVFLLTSARIFWLNISLSRGQRNENLETGAEILLSWVHFRDQQDISLRLNVLDDENGVFSRFRFNSWCQANMFIATLVILYSRLTSLSTIFTFRMSQSPLRIPMSTSDPYVLTLKGNEHSYKMHSFPQRSRTNPSIFSLELRPASYEVQKGSSPTGLGAFYREKSVRFYYLSTLYSDLSLQKCLYVSQATANPISVLPPEIHHRQEIFETIKLVSDDGFIIPNRVSAIDREDPDFEPELQMALNKRGEGHQSKTIDDPQTLNFDWLERGIQSLLTRASTPNTHLYSMGFDECLKSLKITTENKLNTGTSQLNLL